MEKVEKFARKKKHERLGMLYFQHSESTLAVTLAYVLCVCDEETLS